jgi:hypothetical protein
MKHTLLEPFSQMLPDTRYDEHMRGKTTELKTKIEILSQEVNNEVMTTPWVFGEPVELSACFL